MTHCFCIAYVFLTLYFLLILFILVITVIFSLTKVKVCILIYVNYILSVKTVFPPLRLYRHAQDFFFFFAGFLLFCFLNTCSLLLCSDRCPRIYHQFFKKMASLSLHCLQLVLLLQHSVEFFVSEDNILCDILNHKFNFPNSYRAFPNRHFILRDLQYLLVLELMPFNLTVKFIMYIELFVALAFYPFHVYTVYNDIPYFILHMSSFSLFFVSFLRCLSTVLTFSEDQLSVSFLLGFFFFCYQFHLFFCLYYILHSICLTSTLFFFPLFSSVGIYTVDLNFFLM